MAQPPSAPREEPPPAREPWGHVVSPFVERIWAHWPPGSCAPACCGHPQSARSEVDTVSSPLSPEAALHPAWAADVESTSLTLEHKARGGRRPQWRGAAWATGQRQPPRRQTLGHCKAASEEAVLDSRHSGPLCPLLQSGEEQWGVLMETVPMTPECPTADSLPSPKPPVEPVHACEEAPRRSQDASVPSLSVKGKCGEIPPRLLKVLHTLNTS